MTDVLTFRVEASSRKDGMGRQRFTMFWPANNIGPHCNETGVRGQCFHAVISEHVDRLRAAGHSVEVFEWLQP